MKVSSTACKLHVTDEGVQDGSYSNSNLPAKLFEPVVQGAVEVDVTCNKQHEASSGNLWHILNTPRNALRGDDNGLYQRNLTYKPVDEMLIAPYGTYDYRLESVGIPVELESTQVPYVHSNSLTGHANERGSEAWPTLEKQTIAFDSTSSMTLVQELLAGLNKQVVDSYTEEGRADALLAVLDLPPLPPSPDLEDVAPLVTDHMPERHHNEDEKTLYELPIPMSNGNWMDDIVDLAVSVAGQDPSYDCWCKDCAEPPELLTTERMTEDDGWMLYSPAEGTRSPSICSAWEWEWDTFVGEEEKEVARRPCSNQPEWEGLFACAPSTVAHGAW